MKNIVVLGSLNIDMVLTTSRLPKIGETMLGENINYLLGGKGANQAVAAARVGGNVKLLGKVGEDTFGRKILHHLQQEPMDLQGVEVESNIFTGVATIFKLPKDNCITVISGANELVDDAYLEKYKEVIYSADILLVQLEIPFDTVKAALKMAKQHHVTTILNPAPFSDRVKEVLDWVDYLTPNEIEFLSLTGHTYTTQDELEKEMLCWQETHQTQLIVTMGATGVGYVAENKVNIIPTVKTEVKDTTGAGDTFNGVFAVMMSEGKGIEEAIRYASIAASISTETFGAQPGMPTALAIDNRYLKSK